MCFVCWCDGCDCGAGAAAVICGADAVAVIVGAVIRGVVIISSNAEPLVCEKNRSTYVLNYCNQPTQLHPT